MGTPQVYFATIKRCNHSFSLSYQTALRSTAPKIYFDMMAELVKREEDEGEIPEIKKNKGLAMARPVQDEPATVRPADEDRHDETTSLSTPHPAPTTFLGESLLGIGADAKIGQKLRLFWASLMRIFNI